MASLETTSLSIFAGQISYVDRWMLMSTPLPLMIISALYLWFVFSYGPNFMRNRPPFNINKFLIIYDIGQVLYCTVLCYKGIAFMWKHGLLPNSCLCEDKENEYTITFGSYLYLCAKVVELIETVFFVLRKKQEQITFLHIYHHLSMIWYTWIVLKYAPSYNGFFLGVTNCFVHVIMYSYYSMAAIPQLARYLWWKKHMTSIQLIQFFLILLHIIAATIHQGCPPAKIVTSIITGNSIMLIYLFSKFYIDSYSKSEKSNIDVHKEFLRKLCRTKVC